MSSPATRLLPILALLLILFALLLPSCKSNTPPAQLPPPDSSTNSVTPIPSSQPQQSITQDTEVISAAPDFIANHPQWLQWQQTKARKLVAIAQSWREIEDQEHHLQCSLAEETAAKDSTYTDFAEAILDRFPARAKSIEALLSAQNLDPANLSAHALSAATLVESAYLGEGTWDQDTLQYAVELLETIAQAVENGRLTNADEP